MENSELIKLAYAAKENAYAPYSGFHVGAALLSDNEKVFTGCNVENASYPATNCAERTAIFKAVSEGCKKFKKLVIVSDCPEFTYPCGICRQVMSEFFDSDTEIILPNANGDIKIFKLNDLLPHQFNLT